MIRLENVSKYYHNDGNVVLGLHKVNLEFKMGEFIAITGESGSGKSTLLNVISGIDTYEEGEIYFNNEVTSYYDETDWENYRKKYIGFVFQNYNLIDSYTVLENVETALIINGVSKKARRKRAIEILESVGLDGHLKHKGTKLSGGEKQRLAIARAIAKDAPVIVADEPTGNLDSETGKQIMDILKELSKTRLVVMVTHNYELVENYVTRLVRIYDGMIVENKIIAEPDVEDKIDTIDKKVPIIKKATPFAMWNFKNQPKITILSLFVALVTTFIICFVMAAYFESRTSSTYRNYYNNSPLERIMIKKKDKTVFTEEDYNKINNLSNINLIIEQDLIYSQSIELQFFDGINPSNRFYYFNGQIRHLKEAEKKKIIKGRWPENDNEVLISANEEELEKLINSEYSSVVWFDYGIEINGDNLKIVGVVEHDVEYDYTRKVYISDRVLTKLNNEILFKIKYRFITINDKYQIDNYRFEVDPTLKTNEVILDYSSEYFNYNITDEFHVGKILNIGLDEKTHVFNIKEINSQSKNPSRGYYLTIKVSDEVYNIFYNLENLQHTILVKNHTMIDKTINELDNLGYYAFNPRVYSEGNQLFDTILNVLLTFLYTGLVFVIYLIVYVIIKSIFSSRNRDQVILKSIGLDSNSVRLINILQITIYFILSFVILIPLIIYLSNTNTVFKIIFKGFHWNHYALLLVLNIALGIMISLRINKSIQKKSILSSMKAD